MKTLKGDLIQLAQEGKFDAIAHGCNCFCKMGAGIARTIKAVFPEAYQADCQTEPGDEEKLGTCTYTICKVKNGECIIINAYTQYHWRGRGPRVDYEALRKCMQWIKQNFAGKSIGLPKIGAGLAKGDWPTIEQIIAQELVDEDVTIVEFSG